MPEPSCQSSANHYQLLPIAANRDAQPAGHRNVYHAMPACHTHGEECDDNATVPLYSWTHAQHTPSRALVLRRLIASGPTRVWRAIARNAISIFASPVATALHLSKYLRAEPLLSGDHAR